MLEEMAYRPSSLLSNATLRPASAHLNVADRSGFVSAVHEMTQSSFAGFRSPSFTPIVAPVLKRSVLLPALEDETVFSVVAMSLKSMVAPFRIITP